jgi:hypothetical protein
MNHWLSSAKHAYWDFRAGKLPPICFRWPIYDVWRHFVNAESRRLYLQQRAAMAPRPIEAQLIDDLKRDGVAMVAVDDLLPEPRFREIQAWGDRLLERQDVVAKVEAIRAGKCPDRAKSDKFYVVRPLGDVPVFDMRDAVVQVSLSDPILRIVTGYLALLSRLPVMDLWYNIATGGPSQYSQRWHRDPDDRKILKTFLYLHDVGDQHGPFCFIPGTHHPGPFAQKIARLNYPDNDAVERRFPEGSRRVCTGKAGTLVFCDTTGLHKGGQVLEGTRFVFTGVYQSSAADTLWQGIRYYYLTGSRSDLRSMAARHAIELLDDSGPKQPLVAGS